MDHKHEHIHEILGTLDSIIKELKENKDRTDELAEEIKKLRWKVEGLKYL